MVSEIAVISIWDLFPTSKGKIFNMFFFCVGIEWSNTHRSASVHCPWQKSTYLQERTKQLQTVLHELDPHQPVRRKLIFTKVFSLLPNMWFSLKLFIRKPRVTGDGTVHWLLADNFSSTLSANFKNSLLEMFSSFIEEWSADLLAITKQWNTLTRFKL